MPKRKLADLDSPGSISQNLQLTRLSHKFEHGVTTLARALKTARGFERQKLGRREKTAKSQGSHDTLSRLAEEVQVLKSLDPAVTAQRYLFKQLVKTKRIAESPVFVQFREKKKLAPEGPRSTAEANVTARLYKSTPVKNVFPDIMAGIKQLLKVDDAKPPQATTKDGAAKSQEAAAAASKAKRAPEPAVSGDESEEEWGGIEGSSDAESVDFAQFDGRLAPDSDEEDASAGEDASDGGVDLAASAVSDVSVSRSPSPGSPPPKKKQKAKASAAPVTSTTFLPSLAMGGYFSGSESEPEDMETEQPRRKNRMGQQARRALWEKKYGSGANHVKKQKERERRDRSSGWDPRRGAVDPADGKRGRWGAGRGGGRRDHDHGDRPAPRPTKPQDNKPLHPSWEAAKRAKEQKAAASFQGKKVVFD